MSLNFRPARPATEVPSFDDCEIRITEFEGPKGNARFSFSTNVPGLGVYNSGSISFGSYEKAYARAVEVIENGIARLARELA